MKLIFIPLHLLPKLVMLFIVVSINAQTKGLMSSFTSSVYSKTSDAQYVADSLKYRTLDEALKVTNLDDLFNDNGDFTIFAPSESAFSKIPSEKLRQLFGDENINRLNYILSSHIVPGKLTASKILLEMCKGGGRAVFTTIQGNKLVATMKGLDIMLTDNMGNHTKITTADVDRRNAVLHEIDSVLVASRL